MRHSTLGLLIAYVSTTVHGILLVFFVSDLIQLPYLLSKDNDVVATSRLVIVIDVFFFVLEISLCIASILLVIGIKKEHPQYMAPWVCLTAVFVVVHLLDIMRYSTYIKHHQADFTVVLKILPIVILAVLWYPIFKLWRKFVKTRKSHHSEGNSGSTMQQDPAVCSNETDNENLSPMLYPNLGDDNHRPADENLLGKPTLYPNLS